MVHKKVIKENNYYCQKNGCSSEDMNKYLNGTDHCEKNSTCYYKACSFCLGQANIAYDNCLRQSFGECLLYNSTYVESFSYKDLAECPNGYEDIQEIAGIFGVPHWCLKESTYYSKSKYKEIFVDKSISENEIGKKEFYVKSFYKALVDVYAAYTKIFLLNKEIDFFFDGSTWSYYNYV